MFLFDFFRIRKRIPEPWKKYYKKEDLNIFIPNISMYEQVRRSYKTYPDNIAYEYYGQKVKYKKFIKEIDRAAVCFYNMGVKKGDIVTICLPNIPESLIALYGLNKLGAIANMIHPLSSEEEIKFSLNSTNSKYIIVYEDFYKKVATVKEDTKLKKIIIANACYHMNLWMKLILYIKGKLKSKKYPKGTINITWHNFLHKYYFNIDDISFERFGRDTAAVIIHSGGTSGKPKNVVIQNRAFILASIQEKIALVNLKPGDCCLGIMPNFHGFGLSVLMHTPLALGCYTILIPKFNAKKFDVLLKKTKPTCVLGVPTLYEALVNSHNVKNLDLSFLKYVISGGDILPLSLEERINKYLHSHGSDVKITQGYGLSEALAAVTLAHDDINKCGSVGIPLAGNHVKIIDPATRKTLPYGEIGEIVVHSKAFMNGYLNEESETNTALQIHKDGHIWLHTGDLGYMDEDGFVFYKGRIKRMIITSGYNVYPSHIEEVLEAHPVVLQCTVVGVPHPYRQEVPKAFIVLKEGFHGLFIKSEIKDYAIKHLAKYMVPTEFVYRKKLPRTKLGKVDFKTLQEDYGDDDDE